MRKLYENFHIFHFQERIVFEETICGSMYSPYLLYPLIARMNPFPVCSDMYSTPILLLNNLSHDTFFMYNDDKIGEHNLPLPT